MKDGLTTREVARYLIGNNYQRIPKIRDSGKLGRFATGFAAWENAAVVVVCVRTNTRSLPKRVTINGVSLSKLYDTPVIIDGALVLPYSAPMSPEDYANWRLLEN